jgi:hypothetical protein
MLEALQGQEVAFTHTAVHHYCCPHKLKEGDAR